MTSHGNNLLYYDNRTLLERFKGPYKKTKYIKTIVKGNINKLIYWVHSPKQSPERKITCNNVGEKLKEHNIRKESIKKINIKKAYIIHFRFKSTEEFIKKYKRGYRNWFGDKLQKYLKSSIDSYLRNSLVTKQKLEYLERELHLNLSVYKLLIK